MGQGDFGVLNGVSVPFTLSHGRLWPQLCHLHHLMQLLNGEMEQDPWIICMALTVPSERCGWRAGAQSSQACFCQS